MREYKSGSPARKIKRLEQIGRDSLQLYEYLTVETPALGSLDAFLLFHFILRPLRVRSDSLLRYLVLLCKVTCFCHLPVLEA